MSKFSRLLAGVIVAIGMSAAVPAMAQHHGGHGGGHGGWHGGHGGWHGGHGGWHGGGWRGPGIGFGFGFGAPYYYAPYYSPYAYGDCGWVRQRYVRHGRWHVRRVWRCW